MAENRLVEDRLLAGKPIHIGVEHIGAGHIGVKQIGPQRTGALTLLPIVRLKLQSQTSATHAWLTASKEPVALIIRDRDAVRAVQFGTALSIEQLRVQIPELDNLLEPY